MQNMGTRAAVALVVVVLVAIGGVAAPAAGQGPEVPRLTLGMGIDQSVAAWAIIAKEKGYFQQVGFAEVELKFFSSGAAMIEALAAGSLSLGFSGDTAPIIMRGQGLPIVLLSPVGDDAGFTWLFVRKGLNVRSPKDLEGLKFAFPKGSSATSVFNKLMEVYGLDGTKIKVIDMSPPDVLTAYKAGQVDGSFLWQPWPYLAEKAVPTARLHSVETSHFPSNFGQKVKLGALRTIFSGREEFIRKYPRTVDAVVQAVTKAEEFIRDSKNTPEYVRLVAAALKQDPDQIAATFKELRTTLMVDREFIDDMETVSKFLFEIKRIRERPPIVDWLYTVPLERVRPEWVKVRGGWKP